MKKYSRREIIQKGSRLAAGVALGTASLPLLGCSGDNQAGAPLPPEALTPTALENLKLTVLYDNNYYQDGLKVDWGFACLVEGLDHTILFDTGRHDTFLLSNLQALNVDPARIDDIVISHKHMDHTGGLDTLVDMRIGKNIYLVKSLIFGLQGKLDAYGATLKLVDAPRVIAKSALSTGSLKRVLISEQGLIVLTDRGGILVVGCSHPGIVEMVARTRQITRMEVLLVIGVSPAQPIRPAGRRDCGRVEERGRKVCGSDPLHRDRSPADFCRGVWQTLPRLRCRPRHHRRGPGLTLT